ncbi:protein phosphatase 2C domain-containing protein [Streptomyces sp. 5-8]|uniref:Protein phosphatase 2C domain-containing protein n=2 Tax=Streptomyces TaxID=1883 RepID=A0ABS1NUJ9_9ACTN|nr:protein phosphatase 2C domain-containing protein [Streptomyces musisoli]
MSQQGGRPARHEDDWWGQLYDDSTQDTGPTAAPDSLDDRFASARNTVVGRPTDTLGPPPTDPSPPARATPGRTAAERAATGPAPGRAATGPVSGRAATEPASEWVATEPASERAATEPASGRAAKEPFPGGAAAEPVPPEPVSAPPAFPRAAVPTQRTAGAPPTDAAPPTDPAPRTGAAPPTDPAPRTGAAPPTDPAPPNGVAPPPEFAPSAEFSSPTGAREPAWSASREQSPEAMKSLESLEGLESPDPTTPAEPAEPPASGRPAPRETGAVAPDSTSVPAPASVPAFDPAPASVDYVGSGPPTYDPEPTALPLADPDGLGELVPDTVLDGARYGACTLRALSLRGDSARYRGEPRRDSLLTARFGTGEQALVLVAMATGVRGTPVAHLAAAEACRWIARAVGRSHQRLVADIRAARRGDLKSGLHRLTDRSVGRLRTSAAERGAAPEDYRASLRCLLLPADPDCRTRVFFGVGDGGLFRLRDGAWQDIEPRPSPDGTGRAPAVGSGSPAEQTAEGDRLTMDLGLPAPPSPFEPAPDPAPEPPREPFRFRASVARPGDALVMCTAGLADPLRGEPALCAYLARRWSGRTPPGLAGFLADAQVRVKGYADDRTAAAVWEA